MEADTAKAAADRLYARDGRKRQVLRIGSPGGWLQRFLVCDARDHRPKLAEGECFLGFVYRTEGD